MRSKFRLGQELSNSPQEPCCKSLYVPSSPVQPVPSLLSPHVCTGVYDMFLRDGCQHCEHDLVLSGTPVQGRSKGDRGLYHPPIFGSSYFVEVHGTGNETVYYIGSWYKAKVEL